MNALVREELCDRFGAPVMSFDLPGPPYQGSQIEQMSVLQLRSSEGTVVATCGASALVMIDGRRIESYVLLEPNAARMTISEVGRVLSLFATFPERERVAVHAGSIVETGTELHSISKMDALLVMPSEQTGGTEVARVLPIYGNEAEYAVRFGAHRLVQLLEEEGFDLRDLRRPSANTSREPDKPKSRRGFKKN